MNFVNTSLPGIVRIKPAVWALADKADLNGIYHWTDAGECSWHDNLCRMLKGMKP